MLITASQVDKMPIKFSQDDKEHRIIINYLLNRIDSLADFSKPKIKACMDLILYITLEGCSFIRRNRKFRNIITKFCKKIKSQEHRCILRHYHVRPYYSDLVRHCDETLDTFNFYNTYCVRRSPRLANKTRTL
jgi:hypothetical protein